MDCWNHWGGMDSRTERASFSSSSLEASHYPDEAKCWIQNFEIRSSSLSEFKILKSDQWNQFSIHFVSLCVYRMEDLCKPESQRAVIAFLTFEGSSPYSPTNIHARLQSQLKEAALSRSQIFSWAKQFKGRQNFGDEERAGRPVSATTEDSVLGVKLMLEEDRRCTISEIVCELGLTRGTVYRILKDHLQLSKLSARWVPHLLTSDQKIFRKECSQENL